MKKIVIPIIIAVTLGIGGGVAAVMLNKPADANMKFSVGLPDPVYGNYYLDGDPNSDVYFEFTEDFLALRIDTSDPYETFKDALRKQGENEEKISQIDDSVRDTVDDYCAENPYVIGNFGEIYNIFIHWEGGLQEDGRYLYGGTGFNYDGVDTIKCFPFGEFKLVK